MKGRTSTILKGTEQHTACGELLENVVFLGYKVQRKENKEKVGG